MAISNSITKTWTRSSGGTLSATIVFTANDENDLSAALATASTNHAYAYTASGTNMKLFYVLSDKDVTIKINSSSVPDLTITLTANVPYEWDATNGVANPFPATISTLYITNTSGATANIEVRSLSNV